MGPTLRILCVNDVYSLENLPRLATLLRHNTLNAPAAKTLITLAGDFCAPSLLSGLDAGRGMMDCLNALDVTHLSLGNHEDDIPTDELHRRIAEFRGTWLSTNVRGFDDNLVVNQVIEIGRVRVGLVGVVMDDPSAYRRPPFGAAPVTPPNATAIAEAEMLMRERGCACVIPLTHQSVADDRELMRLNESRVSPLSPLFPIILGGHEHTVFLEQLGRTWLVKAGADAEHAIVADLTWPEEKPASGPDFPSVQIRLENTAAYAEDAAMRARVDGHMQKVLELEHATLVALKPGELLSSVGTRVRQTSLGTRICSRIRDALGADCCLINGGGIRANRDYPHRFTYADLKAELPFDNQVVVARLPGSVIRDAIVASRARAPAESGGFLQVDNGMRIEEGTNRALEIGGMPIIDGRDYRVALVRNLFSGMDHQEPLLRFAQKNPALIPPEESGRDIKQVLVESFSIALWKQLGGFDQVDANHDGVVTEEELAQAISRVAEDAPSALAAHLVMHALDRNHDQTLSREEAAAAEEEP